MIDDTLNGEPLYDTPYNLDLYQINFWEKTFYFSDWLIHLLSMFSAVIRILSQFIVQLIGKIYYGICLLEY